MYENSSRTVYTISHSNHTVQRLIELLVEAKIDAVADVRSVPYSRRLPQCNQLDLQATLKSKGLEYVFLGHQLGARPKDRCCYRDGVVDYHLIAETEAFRDGLKRVEKGAECYKIAMMCAEREPLDCHKTILIPRRLKERWCNIKHILVDGKMEGHDRTEERLLKLMDMDVGDLFGGPRQLNEVISEAFDRRGNEIAYSERQDFNELDVRANET